MVDVSGKPVTAREASAAGRVLCSPAVVALLRGDGVPKGDALAVARIAGLQAAKRTPGPGAAGPPGGRARRRRSS